MLMKREKKYFKKAPIKEDTYDKLVIKKLKAENRRLLKTNNIMKGKIKTLEAGFESASNEINNLLEILQFLREKNHE